MAGGLALLGSLLAACGLRPVFPFEGPPPLPVPPDPTPDGYTAAPGSLWLGDDSRRFLAFESRAKRIGDLVTVRILENAEAASEATTELERQSFFEAAIDSGIALQTLITRPILRFLNFFGFTDRGTDDDPTGDVNVVTARTRSNFEGEGSVEREANFVSTIACVVTEISSAGLLHIEGQRHLTINRETQIIALSGWVRPEDIQLDNTVPSSLVASADIHYGGRGAISAKQQDPWLTRIFEFWLPF
jgi:flagellar L-ring protein precursor FlgH